MQFFLSSNTNFFLLFKKKKNLVKDRGGLGAGVQHARLPHQRVRLHLK
jgi:hypothetical protein